MKKRKIEFTYASEKNTVTICQIFDKFGKVYVGQAVCHPDDLDMVNRMTGAALAQMRAELSMLRDLRDSEIIPNLKAIKRIYNGLKKYKKPLLKKELKGAEFSYSAIRGMIKGKKEEIADFILAKEKFYQGVRRNRRILKEEENKYKDNNA
jgi:hypothetical protein